MLKKMFLGMFILLAATTASAQVSWNVKAGVNYSTISVSGGELDYKVGYNVGVGMEYAFNETWLFQPSLMFTAKGAQGDIPYEGDDGELYTEKQTMNALYVSLPLMIGARLPVSEKVNLVISAGPYVALGVGGKIKAGDYEQDTFGTETVTIGDDIVDETKGLKEFDAGIGVGVTAEFGKFFVGVTGEFGLTNLAPEKGDKGKNTSFSLGVGYKF
jgi:hypothetical protein